MKSWAVCWAGAGFHLHNSILQYDQHNVLLNSVHEAAPVHLQLGQGALRSLQLELSVPAAGAGHQLGEARLGRLGSGGHRPGRSPHLYRTMSPLTVLQPGPPTRSASSPLVAGPTPGSKEMVSLLCPPAPAPARAPDSEAATPPSPPSPSQEKPPAEEEFQYSSSSPIPSRPLWNTNHNVKVTAG